MSEDWKKRIENQFEFINEKVISKIKNKNIKKIINNKFITSSGYSARDPLFVDRHTQLSRLIGVYQTYETKFITTTFIIKDNNGNKVNYGLLFSIYDYDKLVFSVYDRMLKDDDNLYGNDINQIEHLYICNAPAFVSMDGEYRKQLIQYQQFLQVYKENQELFEDIEEVLLERIENDEILLDFNINFPFKISDEASEIFYKEIKDSRILIKSLAANIASEMMASVFGYIENHTNKNFVKIIYNQNELEKYKKIYNKFNNRDPNVKYFLGINFQLNYFYNKSFEINTLQRLLLATFISAGVKTIPMTMQEFYSVNDVSYESWRELYFGIICSNLPLNKICAGFPFIAGYTFIQNVDATFFDNSSMIVKYINGKIACNINNQLVNVNDLTEENDRPRNKKFKRLSHLIDKSILYSESNIEMSNVALGIFYEDIGRTFSNWIRMNDNLPEENKLDKFSRLLFKTPSLMHKIIFEYIYEIYCMHSINKIIHLDLHLNNITIYLGDRVITKRNPNPRCLYILDDNNAFLFHDLGYYSSIIDFSRAILYDFNEISNKYGPTTARTSKRNASDRLYSSINKYFPDIAKDHKDDLNNKLISDFQTMAVLCGNLDYWYVCQNIGEAFNNHNYTELKSLTDLLLTISKKAYKYFEKTIVDYLTNEKFNKKKIYDIGKELILDHFESNNVLSDNKNIEIFSDDYVILNIFRYVKDGIEIKIEDETTYPEFLKFDPKVLWPKQPSIFNDAVVALNYDETQNVYDITEDKPIRIKGFE